MAKIKTKTHSGAKKRFKMTASGKVKYQKTNKRHRLTQKDTKRKRIARTVGIADCTQRTGTEKADAVSLSRRNIRALIGI